MLIINIEQIEKAAEAFGVMAEDYADKNWKHIVIDGYVKKEGKGIKVAGLGLHVSKKKVNIFKRIIRFLSQAWSDEITKLRNINDYGKE